MGITRIMYHSALLVALATSAQQPASQPPKEHTTGTRVVLLGTGTPVPDPDRSGRATAIVIGGSAYLVEFGPGVVRRAQAAVIDRGITALEPSNLKILSSMIGAGGFRSSAEVLHEEISARYSRQFVIGRDLDVY